MAAGAPRHLGMDVRVFDDRAELDSAGSDIVAGWISAEPDCLLVPALGTSALGIYRRLAERVEAADLDTSQLAVAQLDEYVDIPPDHPRSLFTWLLRDVLQPLRIEPAHTVAMTGLLTDLQERCRQHAMAIRAAGGIGVAVLGIGPNGHLGYNEPPSTTTAPTRVVDLAPESVASAAFYDPDGSPVPTRALTIGMDLLLEAHRTLVVVTGASKREILKATLDGPVGPDVPSTYLRTIDRVTLIADRDAWGKRPEP